MPELHCVDLDDALRCKRFRGWNPPCHSLLFLAVVLCAAMSFTASAHGGHPLLDGYLDYPALTERVHSLAKKNGVQYRSLGTSLGGHEIHQLTLANGDAHSRPAILIVGGTDSAHIAGTELAIRLAEDLATESEVLKRVTFYIIPQANPDACARVFQRPFRSSSGNGLRTDDDRDGVAGEDPPDDLDGDGFITTMRVYRTGGAFRADEKDPRLDVPVKPGDEKPGEYDLYPEGIDDDADEQWNEDPGDGVDFNRNFTFQYRPFTPQSGPHPVSEIETRAIADFVWDHPNIVLVFCLGPHDNLSKAWVASPGREAGRIVTSVHGEDAPYYTRMAKVFADSAKLNGEPPAAASEGDLLHWSYYHFGRWALGTPSWVIPRDHEAGESRSSDRPARSRDADDDADDASPQVPSPTERSFRQRPAGERGTSRRGRPDFAGRRGGPRPPAARSPVSSPEDIARNRRALQWMEEQKINGFTNWTLIEHPDFPEMRVEVGGFRPWWRTNPPAKQLDELADTHKIFVLDVCQLLPRLTIESLKIEPLGNAVMRAKVRIANSGYLPTSTHHGADSNLTYPVQAEIQLPKSAELINSSPRRRSDNLGGGGGTVEHTWLFRIPDQAADNTVTVKAYSIMAGDAESTAVLPQATNP